MIFFQFCLNSYNILWTELLIWINSFSYKQSKQFLLKYLDKNLQNELEFE